MYHSRTRTHSERDEIVYQSLSMRVEIQVQKESDTTKIISIVDNMIPSQLHIDLHNPYGISDLSPVRQRLTSKTNPINLVNCA